MATSGIDVSRYQGNISWQEVADDGVRFAMIRMGYATTVDSRFESNYSNATKAGVDVGSYLFSYATSVESARREAEFALSLIRGKQFPYPIAYDFEQVSVDYAERNGVNVTRSLATKIVSTFLETVENAGYYVMLYSNLDCIRNYFDMDRLSRFDLWYAQWAPQPTYTGPFGIWQKSSTGRINGISGNVDLDEGYKDYPTIMRNKGLNGFTKDSEVVIAGGYKAGDKGIGIYTLQSGIEALNVRGKLETSVVRNGVFDDATTVAVRELQEKGGLQQTGIFEQKTCDVLYNLSRES